MTATVTDDCILCNSKQLMCHTRSIAQAQKGGYVDIMVYCCVGRFMK